MITMSRWFAGGFVIVSGLMASAGARGQCLEHWDTTVGNPGLNGWVNAIAHFDPDGSGSQTERIIVGGSFPVTGSAGNIAQWNGNFWVKLANGANAIVRALAVFDEDGDGPNPPRLFAGGDFAGTGADQHIGRWNGTAWSTVGGGINGPIFSLHVHDPDGDGPQDAVLIAGGSFTLAGAAVASNIAKWDGKAWSDLGAGVSDPGIYDGVYALASLPDGSLLVGGNFTSAGRLPVENIARWDALSGWSAIGAAPGATVVALASLPDGSPVIGRVVGGGPIGSIARWNGSAWLELGGGTNGYVIALAVSPGSGDLYVGGSFSSVGGGAVNASNIARWNDGTGTWSRLGCGTNGPVYALRFPAMGALAVGGDFNVAGNATAREVAEWSETIAATISLPDPLLGPSIIPAEMEVNSSLPYEAGWYVDGSFLTSDSPLTLVPFNIFCGCLPSGPWPCGQGGFYTTRDYDSNEDSITYLSLGQLLPFEGRVSFPGGRCSAMSTATLYAPGTPPPLPPSDPQSIVACIGSTVRLHSTGVNPDQVVATWLRNNASVADGPTGTGSIIETSMSDDGLAALIIYNASPADAGQYACRVTHPCAGLATSSPATLTILSSEECEDRIARFDTANSGIPFYTHSEYYASCGPTIPGIESIGEPLISDYFIARSGTTAAVLPPSPTGEIPPPVVSLTVNAEAAIQKNGAATIISLRTERFDAADSTPGYTGYPEVFVGQYQAGQQPVLFELDHFADWSIENAFGGGAFIRVRPANGPGAYLNSSGAQLPPSGYAIEFGQGFEPGINMKGPYTWKMTLTPSPLLFQQNSYLSFANSPFANMTFEYFHLEDFEDGALNTPGVTEPLAGAAGPSVFTDSVDGDDGAIDGNGNGGSSYHLNPGSSLTFTFNEAILGRLPTHAGLAWTDAHLGFGNVLLEALDCAGNVVLTNGPHAVGDGMEMGTTAEDRFLGFQYQPGIKKLRVTMLNGETTFEVDHLQYGSTEPTVCLADIAPQPSGNGAVNVDDLLAIINSWGPCRNPNACAADIAPNCPLTGNGIVNVDDLLTVINSWGECP